MKIYTITVTTISMTRNAPITIAIIIAITVIIIVVSCFVYFIVVVIGHRLLEVLLKHCPGMAEAHLLLAESHHLAGDSPVALRKVAHVLHQAPDTLPAHLLLTRIYIHQVSADCHPAVRRQYDTTVPVRESTEKAQSRLCSCVCHIT